MLCRANPSNVPQVGLDVPRSRCSSLSQAVSPSSGVDAPGFTCANRRLHRRHSFTRLLTLPLTGGQGVKAVYDSVGKDTFRGSLAVLRPRGTLVQFGKASGFP